MDDNGYLDVIVGVYGFNKVIMFRIRFIVYFFFNIIFFFKKFNFSKFVGCLFDDLVFIIKLRYCVELKICLKFSVKSVYR